MRLTQRLGPPAAAQRLGPPAFEQLAGSREIVLLGKQIAEVGQLIGQCRAVRTVDRRLLLQGKLEQRSGAFQVALLERNDRARSRVGHGCVW